VSPSRSTSLSKEDQSRDFELTSLLLLLSSATLSFAEPGIDALSLGSREGFGELVGNGREWLIDVESQSKI